MAIIANIISDMFITHYIQWWTYFYTKQWDSSISKQNRMIQTEQL
jgi:hypothetical protein